MGMESSTTMTTTTTTTTTRRHTTMTVGGDDRNYRKLPRRGAGAIHDVIDLVDCSSSSSSSDDDDNDDDDVEINRKGNKKRSTQYMRCDVLDVDIDPSNTHSKMRRKRTRGSFPPPITASPSMTRNDDGAIRSRRPPMAMVEHVNLPPRTTRDGATITFGLFGLLDVAKDRNTLTCECDGGSSSMTKMLEPAVHRHPPPPSSSSSSSSSLTSASSLESSSDHNRSSSSLPYNRQPMHYLQADNWSCGYRNLQMLLSGMMPTLLDIFPNGVPSVEEVQRDMEILWGMGYDARNAEHHGHSLVGKRTWIGTVEVW